MESEIDWSVIYTYRLKIRKKFRAIWRIELVRSVTEKVAVELCSNAKALDIGASDRKLERQLREKGFTGLYSSMDIDSSTRQDYYSLEDIKEQFDVVTMIELVEHITPKEFLDILDKLKNILNPRGKLIISISNIYHPYRYHFGGPSHISAYPYEELAALVLYKNFDNIKLYRVHGYENLKWRIFRRTIGKRLNKYLGIDFAHTIVLVCINSMEK